MSDVDVVIHDYPWLEEIYAELSEFMIKPEEVLTMYSEALKILDANEMNLFVDNVLSSYENALKQLDEAETAKNAAIAESVEKDAVLAEKDAEINRLKILLEKTTQNK